MSDRGGDSRKLMDEMFARAARGDVTDGVRAYARGDRVPASHAASGSPGARDHAWSAAGGRARIPQVRRA